MQIASLLTPKKLKILKDRGWVSLRSEAESRDDFKHVLLSLAQSLGRPTPTRTRELVDELIPQDKRTANPSSLSRMTGMGVQPWHMDLAHRLEPARYLVMGMHDCKHTGVNTELLNASLLISAQHKHAALSEPFLIRAGASSFYATMLSRCWPFVRFDPGCMHGATVPAKQLMQKILGQTLAATHIHVWEAGSMLIIDNWKMLHRRADASCSTERILYRVSVMGEAE